MTSRNVWAPPPGQGGEHVFTDPRKAAETIRQLARQGAKVGQQLLGTAHAMSQLGMHPQHVGKKMTGGESRALAHQVTEAGGGDIPITYAPTSSSNPADPRTSAAGYDPVTQTMRVEWGDGGVPYNYYNVTPQEWELFQRVESPGKLINAMFNSKNYGPVE